MWVFLGDAMLSIVEPTKAETKGNGDVLLVRARLKGDIKRVFPRARVSGQSGGDYRYRALVPRRAVAAKMAEMVGRINYRNFKGTVKDMRRHDAYLRVWRVMFEEQERRRPPKPDYESWPIFEVLHEQVTQS